jgi:hypothetical protein
MKMKIDIRKSGEQKSEKTNWIKERVLLRRLKIYKVSPLPVPVTNPDFVGGEWAVLSEFEGVETSRELNGLLRDAEILELYEF